MLVVTLLLGQMLVARETNITQEQPTKNPHENEAMCTVCHTSNLGGQDMLIFDDISQLCQSCHDGKKATREVHPVNLIPSAEIAWRIPPEFPLNEGKLACSTCHNIVWSCPKKRPANMLNTNFLRNEATSHTLDFCFCCHIPESYQPFNVHDQLDAGKPKKNTCLWCHISIPEVDSNARNTASYGLRGEVSEENTSLSKDDEIGNRLCSNCHSVPAGHPNDNPHMNSIPSKEMLSYMSAYEMQQKMKLPLEQLIRYAQAANRVPQLIPLDENGRVTCYSCHNPHEKDLLLNKRNPRSVGAEPKVAQNHRLRIREGDISCRACHQK